MAKSWLQKYGTYEEVVVGSAAGIIAKAGGGQVGATTLTKRFNQIDTCATDEDSTILDSFLTGKIQGVFNNTNNIIAVYPVVGQIINNVANYKFLLGPGDYVEFRSCASGKCRSSITSL
jgi:hypothetical protein